MEKIKGFLTSRTPITDAIDVPNWFFVALLIVLVLLIIIIISATKNCKNEKTKKCITENNDFIPFLDEVKPLEEAAKTNNAPNLAPLEEKSESTLKIEVLATDNVAVINENPKNNVIEEEIVETAKKKASVAKEIETVEVSQEKIAVAEKVDAVDTASSRRSKLTSKVEINPIESADVAAENHTAISILQAEQATAPATEEKIEAVKSPEAKLNGKFEICNSAIGGFRYILKASNGQLLYESRDYKTLRSCSEAIEKFKNAVNNGNFSVKADKFERYKFILKSPTSNNQIFTGESFANKTACLSNIESVKWFALNSPVSDITEEDFVALSKAYVIPEEIKLTVTSPNGIVGKWEIAKCEDDVKASYVFLLYASNGQLLYESRDYASTASCKNGIDTFIKTVKEGEFIIDPDKSGRYKFILRNVGNNSLMEYIGPYYTTNKAACNSADSVYRFALVSPTDSL